MKATGGKQRRLASRVLMSLVGTHGFLTVASLLHDGLAISGESIITDENDGDSGTLIEPKLASNTQDYTQFQPQLTELICIRVGESFSIKNPTIY